MGLNKYVRLFVIFLLLSMIFSCSKEFNSVIEYEEKINVDINCIQYSEIQKWFYYLCSEELGGRYSGSEGIKKAVVYITDIIGQSDSLEIDVFDTFRGELTNIIYHVKGANDSLIVLGAHYDAYGYKTNTPLPGADDNASGSSVMLSLIKSIQRNKILPKYSIDICLFDGEEIGQLGAKHYLSECKKGIKLYINADTCGSKEYGIELLYSSNHPYLLNDLNDLVSSTGMSTNEYNPVGFTTDCQPFREKSIPFVDIHNDTLIKYIHTKEDDISHISFEKLDIISKGLEAYLRSI